MAGYRKADGLFTNATTKNDQIDRQRAAYKDRNQSEMGVGSDTSHIFFGFDADDIFNTSVQEFNTLDVISNVANGNPDFEGIVSMNSAGATPNMYDDLSNAKDKPNKKGPNLVIPDLDQLIQGSVAEASDQVSTRFENKGFGWRDDRNEPGTATATIGQYFSKHYNSTGESDSKPVLGEAKDLGEDPINYKQP
tara:strand:+ start:1166 stop:1744 length:579 start_codon:yes stop_codon:yes gene_type:complete